MEFVIRTENLTDTLVLPFLRQRKFRLHITSLLRFFRRCLDLQIILVPAAGEQSHDDCHTGRQCNSFLHVIVTVIPINSVLHLNPYAFLPFCCVFHSFFLQEKYSGFFFKITAGTG